MKKFIYLLACGLTTLSLSAQTLGEFEVKTIGAGEKKFKKAPKKIYIESFNVNYQVIWQKTDESKGGRELGGGYRGDVKASLTLGLKGPSEQQLLDNTDKLYAEFVEKIKAQGYEIITAEAAAKLDHFEGWEMLEGGRINEAQQFGSISTAPTGFKYLVKKVNKKGKEKKAFIPKTHKTSAGLGKAVVINVNLNLPFAVEAESQGSKMLKSSFGGVAKVVAKPYYRLEESGTSATYGYAERKIALDASTNYVLKKSLDINGVVKGDKIKVSESAQSDIWGTDAGYYRVFHVDDKFMKNMTPVECDGDKYIKGAYDACSKYLNTSLDGFLNYAAGKK